ncbi:DMT family transporter [Amycolatopsis aidingensis]|uniref:DMT family transporter n=1 Tax=Amycolatopsis aidingensis TaxID=2842453 RepID=UPI001E2BE2C2|nr:DMT family transporter [Amycolatopsis aidingensis]
MAARTDPRLLLLAGAACISVSAMFVKLSGTSPGTAAFWRCLLALPVLLPLALREPRADRDPGRTRRRLAAGVFLGIDLVFWGQCVADVGASIATVLVNVQVVILPGLAWLLSRERPAARFLVTAPLMLLAVALASGAIGRAEPGSDPVRGALMGLAAGAAYAAFLFLLRQGAAPGQLVAPVRTATISATVTSLLLGLAWGGVDLAPGWPAFGWLAALALTGQVGGWVLVGTALPRLRAGIGATLLLLQPVLAVLLGLLLLDERPTGWQLAGCAAVIALVWFTSSPARWRGGDRPGGRSGGHGPTPSTEVSQLRAP